MCAVCCRDLNVNGCQLQYDKRSSQTGDDVVYEAAWNTAGLVQTSAGKRLDVPFLVQVGLCGCLKYVYLAIYDNIQHIKQHK